MTIEFNRAQLIKVAEAALAAHTKAQGVHATKMAKWKADRAIDHAIEYRDKIVKLRDLLTAGLRRGGVMHRKEIQKDVGINDLEYLFYVPPQDYDVRNAIGDTPSYLNPAQLVETKAMLSVLKAATGDTITANEMKLLGFKSLQHVFIAAAQDAASSKSR